MIDIAAANEALKHGDALDVIRWTQETFGDEWLYACSFGAEAVVLIDMIAAVVPDARLLFLDTDVHFPDTLALIDRVMERYPRLRLIRAPASLTLEEQEAQYGPELWKHNPTLCCTLRKVRPMQQALAGVQAWMTGLRREQSASRANTAFVNEDAKFGKIKICPLIHWSWDDIWMYINTHRLPYNPLHDQGYPSIGCMPCTAPSSEQGDSRSGRWVGHAKNECGLHADG